MSTVNVTIRMDKELKQQADELFSDLGMSLSTAFTVFAKQAIREQAIPFTIEREFNTDTINAIKEVEEMKANPTLSKGYDDVSEMIGDILG